ncbi:DUF3551 domain-containing protein [Bradyrhizobium sp. CW1]|nr:DUF3551 domain-containing protein [Bradyrhizobium sp. CW1]
MSRPRRMPNKCKKLIGAAHLTRRQCMAAASGRLVDRKINPRFAYGQQDRRRR